MKIKTAEAVLWGASGIAFLVGIVGLVQRLTTGHTQAGYGTSVPWGLWVVLYIALVGMSAGAFLLASGILAFRINHLESVVRPALVLSAATFIGGMLSVVLDLGHPLRALRLLYATGFSSVMGWMTWFYTAFFVILVLLGWQVVVKKRFATPLVRALGVIGAALAIVFAGAEGALFGVVGARDFWHSSLTPIVFIVEGALAGVALVTFFSLVLKIIDETAWRTLRWLVLGLLLASIVVQWAEFSIGFYVTNPEYAASLNLVLSGPYWWVFWLIQVGLGIVMPIVLLLLMWKRSTGLVVASGLIALTAIATKLNLVITAQVIPESEEFRMAYTGPGLHYDYSPTSVEWLLTLWIVGLVALVALVGYRLFLVRQQPKPVG